MRTMPLVCRFLGWNVMGPVAVEQPRTTNPKKKGTQGSVVAGTSEWNDQNTITEGPSEAIGRRGVGE